MKYLVLARRYRPQTFRDVIGQETVITTLKNALRFERVAHAYLFSGSRGIGKTTVARLFAKALNCQSLSPDFEPCNQCPSCLEILSGQSLDVIEIDGASNRGIDDIRQLNETIGYAPSHGKYKIYIIDEVHMFTKEAFNALLKTLEEPPERAKFFFATTEPHKVLPTIISRCQRFDLQRLTEDEIVRKLQSIASDLKREASPEAIHLMASFAEGSLRDAESLFDQILCFTDGVIQAEHVRNVLGLVPNELLFELDTAFADGRTAYAFTLVENLFRMGKDMSHFAEQLISHYRRLIIAKSLGIETLHLPEPLSSNVQNSTKLYTSAQLFYILETLLNSYNQLQKSPMQRVSLEAILLQILRSKNRIPVEVLVRRLSELEQKLATPQDPEPEILKSALAEPTPKTASDSDEPMKSLEKLLFQKSDQILQPPDVIESESIQNVPQSLTKSSPAQEGFVNLDSAKQSQIEALPSERGVSSLNENSDAENQFGKIADTPNSQNLTGCNISGYEEPKLNLETNSNSIKEASSATIELKTVPFNPYHPQTPQLSEPAKLPLDATSTPEAPTTNLDLKTNTDVLCTSAPLELKSIPPQALGTNLELQSPKPFEPALTKCLSTIDETSKSNLNLANAEKSVQTTESKVIPGRYDILMRFAAVELEGTLKNERR